MVGTPFLHETLARLPVALGAFEPPLAREQVLTPAAPGVVVAEVRHHVEPASDARFFVEFWQSPARVAKAPLENP